MQARRIAMAAATATVLAVAPLSVASAHATHAPHAAKAPADFVISKVSVAGHQHVFNVAAAPATVTLKVRIRDNSATLDPSGVTLTLRSKVHGQAATTFSVVATKTDTTVVPPRTPTDKHHKHHTVNGYVLTTWTATVDLAQGAVQTGHPALYSVTKVTVDPTTATAKDRHYRAGHRHGCFHPATFVVVNRPSA